MPSFTITMLGCKVNQYESAAIAQTLRQAGLGDWSGPAPADLCVVHTCSVTAAAVRKSRRTIRRLAADHPGARIVVTGCYATSAALEALRLPRVTAAIGHHQDVAAALKQLAGELADGTATAHPQGQRDPCRNDGRMNAAATVSLPGATALPSAHQSTNRPADRKVFHAGSTGLEHIRRFEHRQRAIVKVQDGCDAFCSYCIVPHLRSRIHSRSAENLLEEVRALLANGHREIVLAGVFLGAYGKTTTRRDRWGDSPSPLPDLVDSLAELDGLDRLRLSSLEPGDLNDTLLKVIARHPNVCPHLHLPLQSGSDSVLRRMRRQYTVEQYLDCLARAGRYLDRPAFSTDILVGFPGETEQDFAATCAVARQAGYMRIHVFPFSPRPATAAWQWRDQMPPPETVRRRCAELAELERDLAERYRRQFLGQTLEVLLEDQHHLPPGHAAGFTDRYLRVNVRPLANVDLAGLLGRILPVRITEDTTQGLAGMAVP